MRIWPSLAMIVTLALLFTACSRKAGEPKQRPGGVPAYAIWAGGSDGGSYVWCSADAVRDVNVCTVWNDFRGSVVEKGVSFRPACVTHGTGA